MRFVFVYVCCIQVLIGRRWNVTVLLLFLSSCNYFFYLHDFIFNISRRENAASPRNILPGLTLASTRRWPWLRENFILVSDNQIQQYNFKDVGPKDMYHSDEIHHSWEIVSWKKCTTHEGLRVGKNVSLMRDWEFEEMYRSWRTKSWKKCTILEGIRNKEMYPS